MSRFSDDQLADFLVDTAIEAGRRIMAIYGADFDVTVKSDASPVTAADAEAEAIILERLAAFAPDIPVVAEEEVAAGRVPATDGEFFLVDPLDGTKEFVSRNGEFTVNIALIEAGVPVAGVVYAPALGRLYVAAGGAARRILVDEAGRPGTPETIAVREASGGLVAVGSRSHGSAETEAWLSRLDVASFTGAGSSLKFCLVACGEADVYPRFGRTMEWDTAAGDAVLRAAGGKVVTVDGAPLRYGKRDQPTDTDFANPHFIAAGGVALA